MSEMSEIQIRELRLLFQMHVVEYMLWQEP